MRSIWRGGLGVGRAELRPPQGVDGSPTSFEGTPRGVALHGAAVAKVVKTPSKKDLLLCGP
jgi:hypothetical protein